MSYLVRPFVLAWRYWPQIAACYLVGILARWGTVEWAAAVGHHNAFWAAMIMPFAGLATLGSYVAMFLVVRRGVPVLADLPRPSLRGAALFSSIIAPFFAIYLAWQLFKEDWLAYMARVLDYQMDEAFNGVKAHALDVPKTTWIVIVGAVILRYPLRYFAGRLPRWLTAVRIYVDSLWVFLVLSYSLSAGFTFLVNPSGWLAKRRIVVWFTSTRAELFSHVKPLQVAWHGLTWSVKTVFGGAGVPLMWLAVIGIVYGVSTQADWRAAARRTFGDRGTAVLEKMLPSGGFQRRWTVMPTSLRTKVSDYAMSKTGRYQPIVDSAKLILHGGPLALAAYVLGYLALAWLDPTGSFYGPSNDHGFLLRGMAWLVGPHDWQFWTAYLPILDRISQLIVMPLRIALIASAFGYCWLHATRVQLVDLERDAEQDGVARAGDIQRGGSHVAGQQEVELQGTGPATETGGVGADREGFAGGSLVSPPPMPVGEETDARLVDRRARPLEGDGD
ncbi:hypothetical protein PT015_06135 [Candidatus Mycobacterium wuenschmannii]|uniref:Transmembrane protein n=1 Tax=Candidatus Mycobacterium wuenschmannii TaxID=3027808 RepID=A0ABY8W3L2_9MYCO|nr:hypothetical protein [Candidatus Mycobacterium wuenschmannii]WIM89047.1 hypothetical protein PT015_06135 [Candidatus Mycobacterium wuenschmannii]